MECTLSGIGDYLKTTALRDDDDDRMSVYFLRIRDICFYSTYAVK